MSAKAISKIVFSIAARLLTSEAGAKAAAAEAAVMARMASFMVRWSLFLTMVRLLS